MEVQADKTQKGFRICYSSDIHGNVSQYSALVEAAKSRKCDMLLIGGDLMPHETKTANSQLNFFVEHIVPLLNTLKGICEVYLIFGNTDFRRNVTRLKNLFKEQYPHIHMLDGAGEFVFINKPSSKQSNTTNENSTENNNSSETTEESVSDGIVLFGYSFVPLSPHKKKDFEKWDTNMDISDIASVNAQRVFGSKGYSSMEDDYIPVQIDLATEIQNKNTIETDLEYLLSKFLTENAVPSKFIWMIHAPPFRTCLDHTGKHGHVGSVAIHNAIKKYQPTVSFHGHIHETVNMSNGQYREQIGKTSSYSAGNIYGKKLSYLVLNTEKPSSARRFSAHAW